jgi:hypothetical protein
MTKKYPLSPGISRSRGRPVNLPSEVTDARRRAPPPALRFSAPLPHAALAPAASAAA